VTSDKYELPGERIFTWRRVSTCSHPVDKETGEADLGGNLILALPLFRLMRSIGGAASGAAGWDGRTLASLLRFLWQRLRDFAVRHCQGGAYSLLVFVLPDLLGERVLRLKRVELCTIHPRSQKGAADSRRAA
jgi:hypothetical protein